MEYLEEEVSTKTKTIQKLQKQVGKRDVEINKLKREMHDLKKLLASEREKNKPLSDSINKLTAERSKFLRKLRKAGVKI